MAVELEKRDFRVRVRSKGRITLPNELRSLLHVEEGDDLRIAINEDGQVIIQPLHLIDPDQAWFWTKRWQKMEQETQADIDEGRVKRFNTLEDALSDIEEHFNASD